MAKLPFSAERLEGRDWDTRSSRLPVSFTHPVREISNEMDNIVHNAISVIQERARDSDLRIFYFNLMSHKDYDNRDFEKLIGIIADVVDIGVAERKFPDPRDAVIPVTEDIVTLHVAFMTNEFGELYNYVRRDQERDIDKAVRLFQQYMEAVDAYRRNGNQLPRGRGRDDDRGRGRSDDRWDRDERGGSRSGNRDRWNRGAVRGSASGSPRGDDRYGTTTQQDRFDVDAQNARPDDRDSRGRSDRNERADGDRNRGERDRNRDRYNDMAEGRTTRTTPSEKSRVQHMPGNTPHSDIVDALSRENGNSTKGNDNMRNDVRSSNSNTVLPALKNTDVWLPTIEYPHPLAFNSLQTLQYEMDVDNVLVIPHLVHKEEIVDYYAHASAAFGPAPRDFNRFEEGGIPRRLTQLHDALLNPSEDFIIEGTEQTVKLHKRLEMNGTPFLCHSLKDAVMRLNHRLFLQTREQNQAPGTYPCELAIGQSLQIESFPASGSEIILLNEMRAITSFTKLAERMRTLSKSFSPMLWLQLDRYFTFNVNRMLRQCLSIPALRIGSFTEDWLELFAAITESYGEGYRDAINTHQAAELKFLFNESTDAELAEISNLPDDYIRDYRPFIVAMPTKLISINEVGLNLDVDMVADVASQLLPEVNPFFHDLAQDLLTKEAAQFGRFYISTSDGRVLEASRSYINEKAILIRMVN